MAETWTVLRLLTWTTDYLKKHGSDNPRLEAEVLLAHAKACERIMLYAAFDQEVPESIRATFRDLVKRRAEGIPVAYLIGKREFFSLSLRVTPAVLIPRPETESVVIAALDHLKPSAGSPAGEAPSLVADVGTGSGAIAVAIAKHADHCRIVATDISPEALQVAKANAADHQVLDRIEFIESDLLMAVPAETRFRVIASNPPYVTESELATVSPQVKDHEPRVALLGGPTGTEIIERLIPQAADRLLPGGLLVMEISPTIADRVVELLAAEDRFEPASLEKDLAGQVRIVRAIRKA